MAKTHLSVLGANFDVTVTPSFLYEAECPAAVKYGRIDKKPRRTDLPLEVGRSTHKIFEKILLLRMKGHAVDSAALSPIMESSVSVASVSELAEIRRMTDLYLTNFHPDMDAIVGVEEQIGLDENGEKTSWENAAFGGIIDLVLVKNVTGRAVDYKSQWNIFTKDELDRHFQTTFYLVLLRKLYPFLKVFAAEIYYARHGFSQVTYRTAEQLDACEQEVLVRLEAIKRWKNFDPIPGGHCPVCDARFDCPKGRDLSPVPDTIATLEQAVAAAGRLRVMEVVQKDLKKRLRKFCETNGEVAASPTWRVGFVPAKQMSYPYGVVAEKLRQYGYPLEDVAKLDAARVKKILKELEHHNPDAYVDVMSAATVKTMTKFKGYKPGAEDEDEDES